MISKQMKIVFYGLIIVIAVLSFSTSFFFAKSRKTSIDSEVTPKSSPTIASVSDATERPQVTVSTAVTKITSSNERPSDPRDTYTIQKGDSLLGIAQQNGFKMEELTTANGISDPDKILSGQVLIISKGNQVNFTIDNTKATNLQKFVDNGKYPWRLDPSETARSDNAGAYGLEITDNFTLKDKNLNEGSATVTVSKEGKSYLIKLVQPVTKGEKGIWAIVSIAPAT